MPGMHFFPIVGEMLMRPSGNIGFPPVECVVIETCATVMPDGRVMFEELATGHDLYRMPRWFAKWQNGGKVQIAVTRVAYDAILETGRFQNRSYVIGGNAQTAARLRKRAAEYPEDMVQTPIAAVLVDGEWVEPTPEPSYTLQPHVLSSRRAWTDQ